MFPIPPCSCPLCLAEEEHPEREHHRHLRLLLSRLDERQRRWVAAMEAQRLGRGGMRLVSQITGMNKNTLRRGKEELRVDLAGQPLGRVRRPGAGRKSVEKKLPSSSTA